MGFQVILEDGQWVEEAGMLFKNDGGAFKKVICLVHGKGEANVGMGGWFDRDKLVSDSFAVVSKVECIRVNQFA